IQQIGRGVKVSTVQQMFTQGSFINSAQDTDMAITGEGFFKVKDPVTKEYMYTRAGNFTFTKDGYLETPAGYILQGWAMSIPNPGEEAKKKPEQVDIKIIALNAPPVETSQIKVVCNLNSDDTSAYIYPKEGWAELYADQIARPFAEQDRIDAINAVYNFDEDTSDYPNSKETFNVAVRDLMNVRGYVEGPLGVFTKEEIKNPGGAELSTAHQCAYNSALEKIELQGGDYPKTSLSAEYANAYNHAYENRMDDYGFHYSAAIPGFIRFDKPFSAELNNARTAGSAEVAAMTPPAPPDYVYGSDAYYDIKFYPAYKTELGTYYPVITSSLPRFGKHAESDDGDTAKGYANGLGYNDTDDPPDDYNSAYVKSMADNGFFPSTHYTYGDPLLPPLTDFYKQATAAELDSLLGGASEAGLTAATDAGAPTGYTYPFGEQAYDQAYVNAYTDHMYLHGGFNSTRQNLPNFFKITPAGTALEGLAKLAGDQKALDYLSPMPSYPSGTGDTVFDDAYNQKYEETMINFGFFKIPGATSSPYFFKEDPKHPTTEELQNLLSQAKIVAEQLAANAGQAAYDKAYDYWYELEMANLRERNASSPWVLEGNGFAGAWDGSNLSSPIDPDNYTHANPWTIYDSLGNAHLLMVYYQPNPYMENVWDYIITCDPTEDARRDANKTLFMEGATFDGLIQRGKITFTADGPDMHGGVIKDIEAQNIDLEKTVAARLISASATPADAATANSINYYKLDGYYTGSPVLCATTGAMVASKRSYELIWKDSLGTVPDTAGFICSADGRTTPIPVPDKNNTGPYYFGSGLSVSFISGGTPMRFNSGDTLTFVAESELAVWTDLKPNEKGYFDFDVAFVQSATMSPHPPYTPVTSVMIQHISLDMGARNPSRDGVTWILDEQGTTQFATESINILASQDGYPPGSLQRLSIDKDGVVTGIYTNGRHQPLYQIGLTRFINPWGLAKLGDNVYMETRWSGIGTINPPGYGGTGTIRANFLEQSNTDLADEIVSMIVTQRGFQANSKVVTTTDAMLAEVIEMKR
ncbi:MAG: flagellar hook-basal body complex protein, partial [Deltaproteobacteria bacterium]|nr:flagellar hook-basal body complex protein [Deltaproteobacteria bacterium]